MKVLYVAQAPPAGPAANLFSSIGQFTVMLGLPVQGDSITKDAVLGVAFGFGITITQTPGFAVVRLVPPAALLV
jgi:hypothetical protein